MKKINKNVLGMWDALRGLMVIFVILAHSLSDGLTIQGMIEYPVLLRIIAKSRGVVLTTFFIISGYMFKPKRGSLAKQYLEYVRVYVVTVAVMLGARMLQNLVLTRNVFALVPQLLAGSFYGATSVTVIGGVHLDYPLAMWFFAVYMNAWLLLEWLLKARKKALRYLVLLGLPALFFAYAWLSGEAYPLAQLPFYPLQTVIACLLMYIGYMAREENLFFRKIPVAAPIAGAVLAGYVFVFGQVQLLENYYELGALDLLGCISGALLIMYLYIRILNPESWIIGKLMWFGRRSFIIIPIHCIEYALIYWQGFRWLSVLGVYGSTAAVFLLRCVVIVLACIGYGKVQMMLYRRKMKKLRA